MQQPLTRTERDALLRRSAELLRERSAALEQKDLPRSRLLLAHANSALAEYFDRLPVVPVSCCPFDGQPLLWSFDPYGLNGEWWRPDAPRQHPVPCRHFCVLRGAVGFNGKPPVGGDFDAYTGPEVPYVIPRLMAMPTMVAVIGQLPMTPGYTAYTIAYFAQRRPPVQDLAANWPAKVHSYTTALGEKGWAFDTDPWDFNLLPYIQRGQLRWCAPGSNNERLADGPPDSCPYLNLPGQRAMLVVNRKGAVSRGLPDGEPISPFED